MFTRHFLQKTYPSVRLYNNTVTSFEVRKATQFMPFTLNNLWDNDGARKLKTRIGRGQGSGLGKTGGYGMKGQKARTGVKIHPSFEGGQSDLTCRIPKSGFNRARWKEELTEVNLRDIVYAVRKKRLDPT